MNSLVNDKSWLWPRNKFVNRKYVMSEMYENYVDGENWQLPDVSINKFPASYSSLSVANGTVGTGPFH